MATSVSKMKILCRNARVAIEFGVNFSGESPNKFLGCSGASFLLVKTPSGFSVVDNKEKVFEETDSGILEDSTGSGDKFPSLGFNVEEEGDGEEEGICISVPAFGVFCESGSSIRGPNMEKAPHWWRMVIEESSHQLVCFTIRSSGMEMGATSIP